ncbi:Succinate dehydrogenase subunit 7A, mitochondrial [Ancistrocladus abbreviatus]
MAFLLNKASILSPLRSRFQSTNGSFAQSSRGYHIELGEREKALLADDPALRRFKSHTKGVKRVKRMGDVLTIVVVAGCCYEIYVRAVMREEARKAEKSATSV